MNKNKVTNITAKAVMRGNFRAINAYMKTEKKYQINNLSCYKKVLEKEQQNKLKSRRRKEIVIRIDSVKLTKFI